MDTPTPGELAFLRDIIDQGAIHAILFSAHRKHGDQMRAKGYIDGFADGTHLTAKGRLAYLEAAQT